MATICGVCDTQPSRYNCSLVCYTPHKATHPEGIQPPEIHNSAPVAASQPPSTAARVTKENQIEHLLAQNPTLKRKIQAIYAATLHPSERDGFEDIPTPRRGRFTRGRFNRGRSSRGRDTYRQPWTEERGEEEALKMIKAAKAQEPQGGPMTDFLFLCTSAGVDWTNESRAGEADRTAETGQVTKEVDVPIIKGEDESGGVKAEGTEQVTKEVDVPEIKNENGSDDESENDSSNDDGDIVHSNVAKVESLPDDASAGKEKFVDHGNNHPGNSDRDKTSISNVNDENSIGVAIPIPGVQAENRLANLLAIYEDDDD